ncbi:MAG: 1-acyl-sn-glycerol-3-phosphate acyltransferase [Alphaproteobacteria bacterium]|nr:1-acyl-sn-glycerol-3-phosphate acyltransferase [Alphaproteobacteria bacterium]
MLYLRSLLLNVVWYSLLALGCVVNSAVGVFSPKATIKVWNYGFIPALVWCLKNIGGIEVEIRGSQYLKQDGVIYAGKHESALETYILTNYIKKAAFILKKELTYIPIFGWAQYFYGMIPVDRSAGAVAMKNMLRHAKQRVDDGRPVFIFPEGTRKQPGQETSYKPGVALLYQHLELPVVPVATNTGLFWKKNSFLRYSGKVIFEFLEPIATGLDKKSFMTELENKIETKCKELNEETIKNYPYTKAQIYRG